MTDPAKASVLGRTLYEMIASMPVDAQSRIAERIVLLERDTQKILDVLDNPRDANARLVAALKSMPTE
jgi:uncharacterized protein (DUF1778 family)